MPAKYSHVKKRSASGLLKKAVNGSGYVKDIPLPQPPSSQGHHHNHQHVRSNLHIDRSISQAMSAVSLLERDIARILLLRYEHDIARLFSTRLYSITLFHLPTFVLRCLSLCGPSWLVHNHESEEIKDFFRAVVSMDMRQAGDRVATKSVLWSYTALRHFAISNNVPICAKRGLHTLRLLPHYPSIKSHLDTLEVDSPPAFTKPPHLGSLQEGHDALQEACRLKFGLLSSPAAAKSVWGTKTFIADAGWADPEWSAQVSLGYDLLSQTLWHVAREFDVRGYGIMLREKLTSKWCECGCSSDHLGEVCEKTVREEEAELGIRPGKQREWDGRGWGVFGWETEEEEDIWEVELDFGGRRDAVEGEGEDKGPRREDEMTISEMLEWRYFKAEQEKEDGNVAFRNGDFNSAVKHYETAHDIEPELPHYQLNLAAAHLKLKNWIEAERACTKALSQHRSSKGYYRRAHARKMLDRTDDAIRDLQAVLNIQPTNSEARAELMALIIHTPASPKLDTQMYNNLSGDTNGKEGEEPSSSSAPQLNPPKPGRNLKVLKEQDPPWPRTTADEVRLKIVLMPAGGGKQWRRCSHDDPKARKGLGNGSGYGDDEAGKESGICRDDGEKAGADKGKKRGKGKGKNKVGGSGLHRQGAVVEVGAGKKLEDQLSSSGLGSGKDVSGKSIAAAALPAPNRTGNRTGRTREVMEETTKIGHEAVLYPSWERYTVKWCD